MSTSKPDKSSKKRSGEKGSLQRVIQARVDKDIAKLFHVSKSLREFRGTRDYLIFLITEDFKRIKDREISPGDA